MRKYLFYSLIAISLLFTFSAMADDAPPAAQVANPAPKAGNDVKSGVSVGDIYVACKYYFSKLFNTRENVSRKNICNGYFFGSASMLLLLQSEGIDTATCVPKDISTEEIIRGFLEWTDKNQDKMSMLASEALLKIIRQNYHCMEYKPKESKAP